MFGIKDEACYICLNLSTYIKSGIPISRALQLIKGTIKNKDYRKSLERIEEKVARGDNLSEAFKHEGKLYPSIMVDMIKIGEESGNLENVLDKCSKNIMKEREIKNKVIKMLKYPVGLLGGLIIMIFCYGTYILPQFVDMYDLDKGDSSALITLLNSYVTFVEENENIEFIAFSYLICFFILIYLGIKVINLEKIFSKFEAYRMYYEIRILFLINMVMESGVSLTNTLDIFGETLSDKRVKVYICNINEELIKGETLSDSIGKIDVISDVSRGFLVTGEESGMFNKNVEELLGIREKDFDRSLNKLVGIIEPAMFGIIGIVLSAMMLLVLVPTFEGMKHV